MAAGLVELVEIPAGARVVDYGPDAVIAPGLVAANSLHFVTDPAEVLRDMLERMQKYRTNAEFLMNVEL
jgi:predicted phage gp36 major capsid-like protein